MEDGCEAITREDEDRFEAWLIANGAKHPKILWPARDTVGGVRGTTAIEDIETDEHMLEIPTRLMITPPGCLEFPPLKHVYDENPIIFKGDDDKVLSLFLMHERLRGDESFWAPYIRMLPQPGSIADWTSDELEELQNSTLSTEAMHRNPRYEAVHKTMFTALNDRYPEMFPLEDYTLPLFKWAYMTVAARAFGRRLPWTALVPFADCLNHTNVQTKYDYDVDGNSMFRLFPTGKNRYAKGTEVFNSYGRRDNRHLLLEYGFAIEDNEWASVQTVVTLPNTVAEYDKKRRLLYQFHLPVRKTYRLQWNRFNQDVIAYMRLVMLENVDDYKDSRSLIKSFSGPLSMQNEVAALEATRDHYLACLAAAPTTLEQDLELQAGSPPPRLTAALAYRTTRKRIYLQQLQWVEPLIAFTRAAARAAEVGGSNFFKYTDPVARYVKSVCEFSRATPPPIPRPPPLTIDGADDEEDVGPKPPTSISGAGASAGGDSFGDLMTPIAPVPTAGTVLAAPSSTGSAPAVVPDHPLASTDTSGMMTPIAPVPSALPQ